MNVQASEHIKRTSSPISSGSPKRFLAQSWHHDRIAALPEIYREAVILREYEGYSYKQIAEITNASFFEAPTENDLRAIYQDLGSRVGFTEEEQEVTALFAGLGLVFMLFGGALAAVWFNRIP